MVINGIEITPDPDLTFYPGLPAALPVVITTGLACRALITVAGCSAGHTFSWPCIGRVLEPGDMLHIPVTFSPASQAAAGAVLRIDARNPNSPGMPRLSGFPVEVAIRVGQPG